MQNREVFFTTPYTKLTKTLEPKEVQKICLHFQKLDEYTSLIIKTRSWQYHWLIQKLCLKNGVKIKIKILDCSFFQIHEILYPILFCLYLGSLISYRKVFLLLTKLWISPFKYVPAFYHFCSQRNKANYVAHFFNTPCIYFWQ